MLAYHYCHAPCCEMNRNGATNGSGWAALVRMDKIGIYMYNTVSTTTEAALVLSPPGSGPFMRLRRASDVKRVVQLRRGPLYFVARFRIERSNTGTKARRTSGLSPLTSSHGFFLIGAFGGLGSSVCRRVGEIKY